MERLNSYNKIYTKNHVFFWVVFSLWACHFGNHVVQPDYFRTAALQSILVSVVCTCKSICIRNLSLSLSLTDIYIYIQCIYIICFNESSPFIFHCIQKKIESHMVTSVATRRVAMPSCWPCHVCSSQAKPLEPSAWPKPWTLGTLQRWRGKSAKDLRQMKR